MNPYIGHESQIYGVEEHRLVGGKGDGMRLLQVRNGKGLEMTVSLDRCADISRLSFGGINLGYFSPCGYVAPAYYRHTGDGWLRSFTAGFLTTCGLEAVGTPCVDEGEELPLHGGIANTPASHWASFEENGEIIIRARMEDEAIFGHKLRLHREYRVSLTENSFRLRDTVENTGDKLKPFELLYHMNMGWPLMDEDAEVTIPSGSVRPRDNHAAEDIENWMHMEKPQSGYQERCYYHSFQGKTGSASVYQPKLGRGVKIEFDTERLDTFTQWKMMGVRDYVLGLEPGNCTPDGRDVMRRTGMLKFLEPGKKKTYEIRVMLFEGKSK